MTLTYLGPTVGAGDLIVPAASEVALDPLLAEAVLLLRASTFTGATGDDWPNEGTGGAALDAVPSTADPSGIRISPAYFGPGDGMPAKRWYGPRTSETAPDPAERCVLSTPHTAAMNFTDGFFLAAQSKSVPDAASHGFDQALKIGKLASDVGDGTIWNLGLQITTGKIRVAWTGAIGGDIGAGGIDLYDASTIAVGVVLDDPTVATGYVLDNDDPDITVGGRGWRAVGTIENVGTPTPTESTGDLQVGIGKGWIGWAEVYEWDGTTATAVANCDPSDADAWAGPSDTFTTDGTVWTLTNASVIVDASEPGFGGGVDVTQFTVPSSALLTPGTDDFTVAAKLAMPEVSVAPFIQLLSRFTGTFGVDAVGWGLFDASAGTFPPGGLGGIMSPTMAAGAGTWTTGVHLVVLRREGDDAEVWLDGEIHVTLDVTGKDLDADAALGLLQSTVHAGFDYAAWSRALTDTEITVDLPAAL